MQNDEQWLPNDGAYETFTELGLAEFTGETSKSGRFMRIGQRVARAAYLYRMDWHDGDSEMSVLADEYPLEDTCLRY